MASRQNARELVEDHLVIYCPACGTEWASEAAFCGACGTALPRASEHAMEATAPVAQDVPPTPPMAEPPAPGQASNPSMPPAPGGPRQCSWCGAPNPADAQRCANCGAMFPSPETDAAYLAAAQERIEDVKTSLETLRRNWRRRGFGRFFEN
jgi:predicted amidophosphoribosyltransferase